MSSPPALTEINAATTSMAAFLSTLPGGTSPASESSKITVFVHSTALCYQLKLCINKMGEVERTVGQASEGLKTPSRLCAVVALE